MDYLVKRGDTADGTTDYRVRTVPDRYLFNMSVPSGSDVPAAVLAWCSDYGLETPTNIIEE